MESFGVDGRGGRGRARSGWQPVVTDEPPMPSNPTPPRPPTCGPRRRSPVGGCWFPASGPRSLQGDVAFVDVLARMGARWNEARTASPCGAPGGCTAWTSTWRDCSDAVPTLAAVACFADSPTRISGVGFIRTKETDRIGSLVAELQRCGVDAQEEPDGLVVRPVSGAPQGRPRAHVPRPPHGDGSGAAGAARTGHRDRGTGCGGEVVPDVLVGARRPRHAPSNLTSPWRWRRCE